MKRNDWILLAVLVLASLLACRGLLNDKLNLGHDSAAGFIRQVSLYRCFGDGQFMVRWVGNFNFGFGYPLFNFYPPLFYYAAHAFVLLGVGVVASLNIAAVFFWIVSAVGMYLFAREFFPKTGAFLAGVCYTFAPYHIVDIYVRGAFAEFSSFAVFPFILLSLYRLSLKSSKGYFILAALSVAALSLSHNIMCMLFFPVAFVYAIVLCRKNIFYLLSSMITGLSLGAFFWLPAILEKNFVQIHNMIGGRWQYINHFVYPWQLIYSKWGYGDSLSGPYDGMSFQIGPLHLIFSTVAVFMLLRIYRVYRETFRQVLFFLGLMLVSCFFTLTASSFFWEKIPMLSYVQFPWRFLTLVTLSASFLAAGVSLIAQNRIMRFVNIFLAVLVVVANIFYCQVNTTKPLWNSDWLNVGDVRELLDYMHLPDAKEYTPIWVKQMPRKPHQDSIFSSSGQANLQVLDKQGISSLEKLFSVSCASKTNAYYDVFYFPGWQVWIDGAKTEVWASSPNGLIEFMIPAGVHSIRIKFGYTPVRAIAVTVSCLALIFIFILGLSAFYFPRRNVA
ncbi:MAG: hypothetical protein MUF05_06285 [Candidatus Omnitrophica bacterium]|jgi:hypothetical protein|nr:hypothetical protein [Candidatus Omnitrophota bacterium]